MHLKKILFIISILVVSIQMFSSISLLFKSNEKIVHLPLTEDGYYILTVADNIADGKGITYSS